jgi:SprB repeat
LKYTDGGIFTVPDHSHFHEYVYDISAIDVLNTYALDTLYLRIYMSKGHPGDDNNKARIEIDNVQIYAERQELKALITAQTDVQCEGETNGSATVTATGGTPPYTYKWNTVPVQTDATAIGLAAGSYTVLVTDSKACEASPLY